MTSADVMIMALKDGSRVERVRRYIAWFNCNDQKNKEKNLFFYEPELFLIYISGDLNEIMLNNFDH